MLAESSVECGPEDAVLVVPWYDPDDPDGALRFIDLREDPYDLDLIAEAEQHPPLMQALRALNASRSPVFTAKCDAWAMDAEELAATRINLGVPAVETPHGFASYIDLVFRERSLFVSLARQQQWVDRLIRLLDPLDQPYAQAEVVLRPALLDLNGAQEGFAVTIYSKGTGTDPAHAYEHWSRALDSIVLLVRGRELST